VKQKVKNEIQFNQKIILALKKILIIEKKVINIGIISLNGSILFEEIISFHSFFFVNVSFHEKLCNLHLYLVEGKKLY
jgi:hypothetical protein